jgi:hypothetical protein
LTEKINEKTSYLGNKFQEKELEIEKEKLKDLNYYILSIGKSYEEEKNLI